MPSKILMYSGATTGTTTTGDQYAFFINENGLPTVKNGSQVITFGTSGYALAGSSGTSGIRGTSGVSGTAGVSGTSGQNGAPGDIGTAGRDGTSGVSGTAGINGVDGASGSSGAAGSSGSSGISYGTSGSAGSSGLSYGTSGSSGGAGVSGTSGVNGSNGSTALGAASKGGSFIVTGFTYNETTGTFNKVITFSTPFANTNYSIAINYIDNTIDNQQDPYNFYPSWASAKTVSGFTINTVSDNTYYPTVSCEWLAVSQGETGVSGAPGSSGTAGSSGLSYGTSGSNGLNGTSGIRGTNGSSGNSGSSGSSGAAGVAGTSGTSSSGGGAVAINSKNYEIMNVDLTSGTTVNGGWEYLGGMFGIISHWGYDSSRNYEFGATYPINIAVGKTLKDVIFPIQVDNLGSVPYKIVIWKKQPGTFYPGDKIVVDEFNINPESTGYNVIEYNVDFTNDGSYQSSDLFFMSIWRFDSAGDKHRFRGSVNTYQDVGYMGIFNPSTKDFASGYQFSMTTIYNSNWAGGGVPSTYGPGSYGTIYFGGSTPCFWRIA